jgi:hypothetical protein
MAKFEVVEPEGMRFVKIALVDETVRAESGTLSSMTGDIVMDVPLPSVGRLLKSYLAEQTYLRPTYTGTGDVLLEASFAGFYVFELQGETWILESGSYWASEASVEVSATRERSWTSFWAGEGFIDWQTKVSGHGRVALKSQARVALFGADHLAQQRRGHRLDRLPPRIGRIAVDLPEHALCWRAGRRQRPHPIITTRMHFGGVRHWFSCPSCGRRYRILYGGARFRCRPCRGARYESQYQAAALTTCDRR